MKKDKTSSFAWEKNKLAFGLGLAIILLGISVALNQYLSLMVFRAVPIGDEAPRDYKSAAGLEETAVFTIPANQAAFEGLSFIASPDGKQFAYILKNGGRESVVLNGAAGASYDSITFLRFSPDGKRLAYGVKLGGQEMVVLDGREGKLYDWIFEPRAFTPDSRYFYYKARARAGDIMVFNTQESRAYDRIYSPFVSADGTLLKYYGLVGDKLWQGSLGLEAVK